MNTFMADDEVRLRVTSIRVSLAGEIVRERARRRKRRIITASAIGAAVVLTGAALVIEATSDQVHYEVFCYETQDLDGKYTQVQSALGVDDHGNAERTEVDPVETCGDMWRMGALGQATPPADPNTANFEVPELVGCTLPNGMAAGIPRGDSTSSNTDLCNELGLTPWG